MRRLLSRVLVAKPVMSSPSVNEELTPVLNNLAIDIRLRKKDGETVQPRAEHTPSPLLDGGGSASARRHTNTQSLCTRCQVNAPLTQAAHRTAPRSGGRGEDLALPLRQFKPECLDSLAQKSPSLHHRIGRRGVVASGVGGDVIDVSR